MTAEVVGSFVPRVVPATTGDDKEFEAFYQRYYPCVLGYAWRVFGPADAEDIAQETMSRAYTHFTRLDPARDPWPWLSVVARHVGTDIIRGQARTVAVDDQQLAAVPTDERDTPLAHVLANDDRRTLTLALAALSTTDRQVLQLREYDDLAVADIAALLDRSETAIRQQLFRARRRLAERFRAVAAGVPAVVPVLLLKSRIQKAWRYFGQTVHTLGPATTSTVFATSSLLAVATNLVTVTPSTPAPRTASVQTFALPDDLVAMPAIKAGRRLPLPVMPDDVHTTLDYANDTVTVNRPSQVLTYTTHRNPAGAPLKKGDSGSSVGVDTPIGHFEAEIDRRRYNHGPICELGVYDCDR